MNDYVIINPLDNVGVLLKEHDEIPVGHKIALKDIKSGDAVIKYGTIIGRATKNIKKGEWVHSHNLKSHLDENISFSYNYNCPQFVKKHANFRGFLREDGRVGIRNDIYIIPTVGCVNSICKELEQKSQSFVSGTIDSILALPHQFGCSQLGEDAENIKMLLCNIAMNPNASFVIFVGLGCENNSLKNIEKMFSILIAKMFKTKSVLD